MRKASTARTPARHLTVKRRPRLVHLLLKFQGFEKDEICQHRFRRRCRWAAQPSSGRAAGAMNGWLLAAGLALTVLGLAGALAGYLRLARAIRALVTLTDRDPARRRPLSPGADLAVLRSALSERRDARARAEEEARRRRLIIEASLDPVVSVDR